MPLPAYIRSDTRITYALIAVVFGLTSRCSMAEEEQMCRNHYANGELKFEVPCPNHEGFYEGKMSMYHENGKLKAIRHFRAGTEVDTAIYYHLDGKTLAQVIPYENGEIHGRMKIYAAEGYLQEELHYQEGKKYGRYIAYDAEGKISLEGEYAYGLKWGSWSESYSTGAKERFTSFTYRYNNIEGPFAIFRPTGIPYITGYISKGLLEGEVKYYNQDGAIVRKERWRAGQNRDYQPHPELASSYDANQARLLNDKHLIIIKGESVEIRPLLQP